jgi:pimeloyl-ACP methyl ester carboxylesterase
VHRAEVRRHRRHQIAAWKPGAGAHHRGSLAVRTLGNRGSPVVLLHGLAASGRYWGAAYDSLARDHRLVVPDLLGFGRSPRPRSGYGPDDHARAVARCLHEVGVADEPAVVVGHSLGALVALRLADLYPELVAGVVGFGPPIAPGLDAIRHRLRAVGPGARLFGLDTRWAELACRALCEQHSRIAARLARWWRPDLPAELATDAVEHSWSSYCETLTRVVLSAEAPAWLESIRAPVHLVMGSEDKVPDADFVKSLATRIPNVTTVVWPSAEHDVPLVHGPACRVEIEEFLAVDRERLSRVR